jgi:hypothetical protein
VLLSSFSNADLVVASLAAVVFAAASRGPVEGLEGAGVAPDGEGDSSAMRAMPMEPSVSLLLVEAAAFAPTDTMLLRSGAVVNELKLSCFGRCIFDVAGEPVDGGNAVTSFILSGPLSSLAVVDGCSFPCPLAISLSRIAAGRLVSLVGNCWA